MSSRIRRLTAREKDSHRKWRNELSWHSSSGSARAYRNNLRST
jgi:hypothetical protein